MERSKQIQFKSQTYHLLAVGPQAYHLLSELPIHLYNGASLLYLSVARIKGIIISAKHTVVKSLGSVMRQH